MAELDAIIAQCRGRGAFADGIVKDTSNRSNRDWPWWSVEIERTREDGDEKCRFQAEIMLNSPARGVPSVFKARWLARIWRGVTTDSFRQQESWPLAWETPCPDDIQAAMTDLFTAAEVATAAAVSIR